MGETVPFLLQNHIYCGLYENYILYNVFWQEKAYDTSCVLTAYKLKKGQNKIRIFNNETVMSVKMLNADENFMKMEYKKRAVSKYRSF